MRARTLIRWSVFTLLAAGSALITVGSAAYFDADELAPFVIEKLPLPLEDVWLGALKVHVVAAAFGLPACLLLASAWFLKRLPKVHRWLGRVNAVAVLFALIPSGSYLALFAKGGAPSTVGFLASGAVMGVAMVKGVTSIWRKDTAQHRRWVMHVLGQMSVAVTSRAMLFAFDSLGTASDAVYLVSLWVPVLGTLLLVEVFFSPRRTLRSVHVANRSPAVVDRRHLELGPVR